MRDFEADRLRRENLIQKNLNIIEELASKRVELDNARNQIEDQLSEMMTYVKDLSIENHNLKDRIVQLEGMKPAKKTKK